MTLVHEVDVSHEEDHHSGTIDLDKDSHSINISQSHSEQ